MVAEKTMTRIDRASTGAAPMGSTSVAAVAPSAAVGASVGAGDVAELGRLRRPSKCPHCGADAIQRWGRADNARQRWRCRDCSRTFSMTTGTPLAGLHQPALLALVAADMAAAAPLSCRALAARLDVDRMTVWHWRRRVMRLLREPPVMTNGVPVLAVVRESRKASREWGQHRADPEVFPPPDRLRWVDYRRLRLRAPDWMPRHRVNIVAASAHPGDRRVLVPQMADGSAIDAGRRATAPTVAAAAVDPVANERPRASECRIGRRRDRCIRSHRPVGGGGGLSIAGQEDGAEVAALARFLRRFRGPASRHLDGYLAWFTARREGSVEASVASACPLGA